MSELRNMAPTVRVRILAKLLILNGMLYTMERNGPNMNRYLISHKEIVKLAGFRADLPPGEFDLLRHSLREYGWLILECSMGDYFLVSNQFVQAAIRLQARMVMPTMDGMSSPTVIEDHIDRQMDRYYRDYCNPLANEKSAA